MTTARDPKRAWPGAGLVAWLRGAKAYVFGLPMIMMDLTKQSMTAVTAGEIAAPIPAPATGTFTLTVRIYWPRDAVLDGIYTVPPVTKVD